MYSFEERRGAIEMSTSKKVCLTYLSYPSRFWMWHYILLS